MCDWLQLNWYTPYCNTTGYQSGNHHLQFSYTNLDNKSLTLSLQDDMYIVEIHLFFSELGENKFTRTKNHCKHTIYMHSYM